MPRLHAQGGRLPWEFDCPKPQRFGASVSDFSYLGSHRTSMLLTCSQITCCAAGGFVPGLHAEGRGLPEG